MSAVNIIRAWKDRDYAMSLSPSELASLPENPAGDVELKRATANQMSHTHFIDCSFVVGGC